MLSSFRRDRFRLSFILIVGLSGLVLTSSCATKSAQSSDSAILSTTDTLKGDKQNDRTTLPPDAPPSVLNVDPAAAAILADKNLQSGDDEAIQGLRSLQINSALGRVSATCDVSNPNRGGGRFVVIVKQWHPSANVNSVPATPGHERVINRRIPQAENQIAIYRMLDGWVSQGQLRTILVEGCEQGISKGFEKRYNGWNLRALERRSQEADYASVITHVGLKIKAKLGALVDVVCADDDSLIRMHELAFSDARGIAGFLGRLEGANGSDPKTQAYLSSVVDLYKLPADTTVETAVTRLKTELQGAIERLTRGFEDRNKIMVRRILGAPGRPMALVVGSAHATDLKSRLEKESVPCAVVEPVGFRDDADALLEALKRWK